MTNKIVKKTRKEKVGRISFEYGKGVRKNKDREAMFRVNMNMWFRPFVKEMNAQKVLIKVKFVTEYDNIFSFKNITTSLKKKVIGYYSQFQTAVQI